MPCGWGPLPGAGTFGQAVLQTGSRPWISVQEVWLHLQAQAWASIKIQEMAHVRDVVNVDPPPDTNMEGPCTVTL